MDGDGRGADAQPNIEQEDANGTRDPAENQADRPTTNPVFSIAGPSPAFTQASPPPPPPPAEVVEARRDARIKELERLLEKANEQIERGASVLERSRRRRG